MLFERRAKMMLLQLLPEALQCLASIGTVWLVVDKVRQRWIRSKPEGDQENIDES